MASIFENGFLNEDILEKAENRGILKSDLRETNPKYLLGNCECCGIENLMVRRLSEAKVCESCSKHIINGIEIDESKNLNFLAMIDSSNVGGLFEMGRVDEAAISVDMKKLQDGADKQSNGDIIKFVKDFYNLGVYKVYGDSLDFFSATIPKGRFNKLMIDFDGEFKTEKSALANTPDKDGTIAPGKVKGKGLVSAPVVGTQAKQVSAVSAPKAGASVAHPATPTKAKKGGPKDEILKMGRESIAVKFDGESGNGLYSLIFTYKDRDVTLDAGTNIVSSGYGLFIGLNIDKITNGEIKKDYTINVFGCDFKVSFMINNDQDLKDMIFRCSSVSGAFTGGANKFFDLSLENVDSIEEDLETEIEGYLDSKKLLPELKPFAIGGLRIAFEFVGISTANTYKFNASTSTGNSAGILFLNKASIDKYLEVLYTNIGMIKEIPEKVNITVGGKNTVAMLDWPDFQKGNISYNLSSAGSNLSDIGTIEVKNYKDINDELNKFVTEKIGDKDGAVSPKTAKELIGGDIKTENFTEQIGISDSLKSKIPDKSKELYLTSLLKVNKDNVLYQIEVTVTDMGDIIGKMAKAVEDLTKVVYGADWYAKFGIKTKTGVDDLGHAFIIVTIQDKDFIKEVIKEYKLDEAFGLRWENVKLKALFEGRTRKSGRSKE